MLKIHHKRKFKNVQWVSGNIYSFRYRPYQNDGKPLVIFLYHITGHHPKTRHQWDLFTCINFHYVPRGNRKQFAKIWFERFKQGKPVTIQEWKSFIRRYPYLRNATRRYLRKGAYILNPKMIPFEHWESAIRGSFTKDFSRALKTKRKGFTRGLKSLFGRKL